MSTQGEGTYSLRVITSFLHLQKEHNKFNPAIVASNLMFFKEITILTHYHEGWYKITELSSRRRRENHDQKAESRKQKAEKQEHEQSPNKKPKPEDNNNNNNNGNKSNNKSLTDIVAEFDNFCKTTSQHLSIKQMREILEANNANSSGSDDAVVPRW